MESSDTPQSPQSPQSPPTDGVISMMAWLEVHKKRLAIGAGVALVVICGAMLVAQQQAEKERAASAALSDVRLPFSPSAATPPGTAEALAKVASEHKGSQAAARALLLSAGVLFSEAKSPADFAAAEKRFAEVSAEYPNSPWNAQAALGVAASLKAQGKPAEATAKYEDITKRFASSAIIDEAKLALARLYEGTKGEDAFKLYDELIKGNPNSVLTMEATMRQDDLVKANTNLAKLRQPPTPPASMTPPPASQQVKITPMTNVQRTAAATNGAATKPIEIKLNSTTPTPGAANTPAVPAK